MEVTVYNPQKGRLETVEVEFTNDNTTWFNYRKDGDISMITDFDGGLLISEADYTYPLWIYEVSRSDIGYNQKKARRLRHLHE